MAVLSYAGFSALASTTWNLDSGEFYGTAIAPQYAEVIAFGAETLYPSYKTIDCTLTIKDQTLYGYLRVEDLGAGVLDVRFVVGDAIQIKGDFDLVVGLLTIYNTDSNIFFKYVP
jgi:hypothetical protein